ncbi:MAG TPA: ergothioneine biosynthesis glutamate--cysteine ligase EgtA [Dermatophilaceae bacterium]|nr:ergothioneine biosynthesis glutamate--cysteine ligase EgtA [Dermatophilaceae bacterium]
MIRDRDEAEGYVAMVCFKHGPPGLHGVELEWTVHHGSDLRRPLDANLLSRALGPHAPRTINPHHDQLPLPAGSLITVEPGGQVEISTPPTRSAAGLISTATADAAILADLLDGCGLVLGPHGTDSHRPPNRLLQVPRYQAMQAAFDLIGPEGSRMMCSTASMQVCLDAGEADQSATRWRAAHALGPSLVALFANSPNLVGRRTGWVSSRLRATLGTCPPFTLPPEPSDDPAGQWARMAMEAPVICIRGDDPSWAAPPGLSFAAWIAEPVRGGRKPTLDDLDYHLSTLFPPVRPRGYLEIRYLDSQPDSRWVTPFVVLAALMARPSTIDQVLDVTEASGRRWIEAARDGLADPVLAAAARKVVQLGADSLDHLDLTATQRSKVLDDLVLGHKTISASQRCSA